jgi:hypothetical protein
MTRQSPKLFWNMNEGGRFQKTAATTVVAHPIIHAVSWRWGSPTAL